ncbi:PPC domain-containing protein [Clostridium estertheticum]|uniref:PPC domain-containing protein n=1 Tax=Clostridium estertheticum TaxID=238834 RepID=UPI001CF404DB|nr:PPC domain-containing protein [Clostridium estertheticum]MCB2306050.1 PPC domain-containing protein [Clostridium estertheticum]MCB2346573.1 PPC domain-containing protein [Clostridium estertheticum]MCB2348979.1 PPC domain-containing protein [Clostridium estertheticum]WAG47620.1 PPC domain-containing protein [Clostridium estertheticum]
MRKKIITSLFILVFLIVQIIVPTNIAHAAITQTLTLGSTVTSDIVSSNDQDIYKIVLPTDGKLNIKMITSNNKINLNLKDDNGNQVLSYYPSLGNGNSSTTWSLPIDLSAGTYYFTVIKYVSDTVNYSLGVNFTVVNTNDVEPNNSPLTAQPLTLNSDSLTGFIGANDDQDTYKFTLPLSGRIDVKILSSIYGVNLNLNDNDGKQIFSNYVGSGSEQSPKTWTQLIDLKAGTYYISVLKQGTSLLNNNSNTGKYTLRVNYTPVYSDDVEPNNGTLTAQPLNLNSNVIIGFIACNDDQNTYKIILPIDGKITLKMISSIYEVNANLADSDGNQIFSSRILYGSDATPKTWSQSVSLKAGTYYFSALKQPLGLLNNNLNTGKYTVAVSADGQPAQSSIPVSTLPVSSDAITISNNPVGTLDVVTLKNYLFTDGDKITIYSDAFSQKTIGSGTINSNQYRSTITTTEPLAKAGGYIYVTVTSLYKTESSRLGIQYNKKSAYTSTDLNVMPAGTVLIGTKSYTLEYANNSANSIEINNAIVTGGEIFVKDYSGNWIDNLTGKTVDQSNM